MACESEGEEEIRLLISTLPRVGWSTNGGKYPPLYQYKGFWYPSIFLQGIIRVQEMDSSDDVIISPSHIIIASLPKSGTTWLKALAFSIVTRTRFDPKSKDHPLLSSFPHDLIPYIETHRKQPSIYPLPLLSTHLPYSALLNFISRSPSSSSSADCKIVYIWRNPEDVFVSLWNFLTKINPNLVPLETAFELFTKGVSSYGPYWDHVLGYWTASLDHPDRSNEDMLEDGISQVKRLAEFMGYPFSDEEETEGLITRITEMCSFESLSNLEVNKFGTYSDVSTSIFFRKARMEDWRNYFNQELADKLDKISLEKFKKYELTL